MNPEKELYAEMENGYRRAGTEFGYWVKYFIRDLRVKGALRTAKDMLRPRKKKKGVHRGLQRLLDAGRTDLSLERLVLEKRFRKLFTTDELAEAQRRFDAFPADLARRPIPPADNHPETLSETRTYYDGAVKSVLVNIYERDPAAREVCIRKHGARCVVCGLDFEKRYGAIGRGFIHVHHLIPLSLRRKEYIIKPEKDLVPVCPNCHAMLHTSDPPLSVPELKAMLR